MLTGMTLHKLTRGSACANYFVLSSFPLWYRTDFFSGVALHHVLWKICPKELLNIKIQACFSLQSLSHIGQGNSKCLHSWERILEIQDIRISINASKLHHLQKGKKVTRKKNIPIDFNITIY